MRIAESIAMNAEMNSTPSDQLKALDYLSKIEGDYAATKQDVSLFDKSGADKIFIEK